MLVEPTGTLYEGKALHWIRRLRVTNKFQIQNQPFDCLFNCLKICQCLFFEVLFLVTLFLENNVSRWS